MIVKLFGSVNVEVIECWQGLESSLALGCFCRLALSTDFECRFAWLRGEVDNLIFSSILGGIVNKPILGSSLHNFSGVQVTISRVTYTCVGY